MNDNCVNKQVILQSFYSAEKVNSALCRIGFKDIVFFNINFERINNTHSECKLYCICRKY